MGLFKSKRERQIERELEVRRGLIQIKKHIAQLKSNETDFVKKARRARELRDTKQLGFLKKTIQKTATQRILMERQLLTIQTASQIQDQAKCHAQFAKAMTAVSKSIAELFQTTDLVKVERDFEKAMQNAETLEERTALFLDMSASSMVGYDDAEGGELVSEQDVDQMLDDNASTPVRDDLDDEIDKNLKEIENELKRAQKGN